MTRTQVEGSKVFIDGAVLKLVKETCPPGISRTGWVNYLVQLGATAVPSKRTTGALNDRS